MRSASDARLSFFMSICLSSAVFLTQNWVFAKGGRPWAFVQGDGPVLTDASKGEPSLLSNHEVNRVDYSCDPTYSSLLNRNIPI
ncbi:Fe2OG dioxygenase domain-containing protein [Psidium guajava]|nr:Fe2OG dioxygenase domain-containing protein [Psidium guajava]